MIDHHVHSTYSDDAHASLKDMCAKAVEIGLEEIGFVEHADFGPVNEWTNMAHDYLKRVDEIELLREEYAGRLSIRAGIEVDYQARNHSDIVDFLGSHKFDYVVGGAHYGDGVILEGHEDYFPSKSLREAYVPYFDEVLAAARSGLFDTLAHMDLCKRYGVLYYGPLRLDDFRPEIEEILRAVITNGIALEVNTSGLRQNPKETYPGIDTLKLYRDLGGSRIEIGSDAHRTEHLAFGVPRTLDMLGEIGLLQEIRTPEAP